MFDVEISLSLRMQTSKLQYCTCTTSFKNYFAFGCFWILVDRCRPPTVCWNTMLCECMSFNTISFSALREPFIIISSPLPLPLQSSSLSLRTEYRVYLTVNLEIMHSSCEWVSKVEWKKGILFSPESRPQTGQREVQQKNKRVLSKSHSF